MARKCAKCGVTSDEDSTLTFHRFPQPSVHGSLKAKVWATFCFPDGDWTSDQSLITLYKQHMMLCSKHFDNSSFTSDDRKRLNKFAIPTEACNILTELRKEQLQSSVKTQIISDTSTPQCLTSAKQIDVCMPGQMETTPFEQVDDEIAPMGSPSQSQPLPDVSSSTDLPSNVPESFGNDVNIPFTSKKKLEPSVFKIERNSETKVKVSQPLRIEVVPETTSTTLDIPEAPSRLDSTVFKIETILKTSDLGINNNFETKHVPAASNCKKHLQIIRNLKRRIKFLENKACLAKLTTNDAIKKLVAKISEEFREKPLNRLGKGKVNIRIRRWTQDDKIRALRLYKKSPSYYRLMRQMFDLPSPNVVLDFVLRRQVKSRVRLR